MKTLAILATFAIAGLSAANLVRNGDFVNGLTDWASAGTYVGIQNAGGAYGQAAFLGSRGTDFGVIFQGLGVMVDDLTQVSFETVTAPGEANAATTLYYEIQGSGGFTLSRATSASWQTFDLTSEIKALWAGQKLVRIGFYETYLGDYGVLVDNVTVNAVPEPSLLAAFAPLALFTMRIRRPRH
jgi:hypothetical protein